MTCLHCGSPSPGKWCPGNACRNAAWKNRRDFGAALVSAGVITDRQIAAVLDALNLVSDLAALAQEQRTSGPCTGGEINMKGMLGDA